MERAAPNLPYPAQIEAYGAGGFRFAGMSHRGSLLCLPNGIWGIDVAVPDAIGEGELALVLASTPPIEHLLIGTGRNPWLMPESLRARLRTQGIVVETMSTRAAVHTYNQLLAEGRRIGALLLAVE
ncbi:MAG: Mth938-like domain-containing protein [Rhodoplanes sp.]